MAKKIDKLDTNGVDSSKELELIFKELELISEMFDKGEITIANVKEKIDRSNFLIKRCKEIVAGIEIE